MFNVNYFYRISLKSYDSTLLKTSCTEIIAKMKKKVKTSEKQMIIKGPTSFPIKRRRYCVLTSPHVNKKSREHFEICIYKQNIDIYRCKPEIIKILSTLLINSGVQVEIKTFC